MILTEGIRNHHSDRELKASNLQCFLFQEDWCSPSLIHRLSVKSLCPAPVIAEFSDSSVRILDNASLAPDKSAVTTVPQLSTHNLRMASCSLPTGRLYGSGPM